MAVLCPDVQTLTARVGCRGDPCVEWPGLGPGSGYSSGAYGREVQGCGGMETSPAAALLG